MPEGSSTEGAVAGIRDENCFLQSMLLSKIT
jgi:hypothetical protein